MKNIKKVVIGCVVCMILFSLGTYFIAQSGLFSRDESWYEPSYTTPTTKPYKIEYTDSNGKHVIPVDTNDMYRISSLPQKTGYEFMGLYDATTGGTQYVDASGSAISPFVDDRDIVLYPQFKAKEYTLVFDYQGAEVTGSRSMNISYDSEIVELPFNLSIEHKNFMGWYTKPNCEGNRISDQNGVLSENRKITDKTFDLSNANNEIKLYAGFKWEEFVVTFYAGDGYEAQEITVTYGTQFSKIAPEICVNNKMVISWSKKRNDTEKTQIFTGEITGDIILYAAEYAPFVEFDANGGKELPPIVARTGEPVQLPVPVRENYKFLGWQDTNGNKLTFMTMPEDSETLVAQWQAMVVFKTNGGDAVANISEPQGTAITLPVTEKEGYLFAGWYNANGKKYESDTMPSESVVLTAKYYKVVTEKVVLLAESEEKAIRYYSYSSTQPNTPSISDSERRYFSLDVSKFISKGIGGVKLTAHYRSRANTGASFDAPVYTYMSWYSEKTVSEAYKVWGYGDEHTNNDYQYYTRETHMDFSTMEISTSKLYICIYSGGNVGYWSNKSDYQYWSDFWVEIEYTDTSTLY